MTTPMATFRSAERVDVQRQQDVAVQAEAEEEVGERRPHEGVVCENRRRHGAIIA